MKKYYAITQEGSEVDITIYGDITSYPMTESDVSSYVLSKQIEDVDADVINVYINSYGGEVSEGLAIYNALRRHKASVCTYCDGFACSAASVVFMAGDERIMHSASLLMIHNAWCFASGNASQLRKAADDLEIISQAAANAYKDAINIDEEQLSELLDNESWITSADALEMGFATEIKTHAESQKPAASARELMIAALTNPKREEAKALDADGVRMLAKELLEAMTEQAAGNTPPENKVIKFLDALTRKGGTK